MSDKTLMLIIGMIAGLLLSCLGGLILVATGAPRAPTAPVAPPDGALIEAVITESYLNRTFIDSVAGMEGASFLYDGRVDVQPGNRLRFVAQLDTPIGLATTRGAITISAQDGRLAFRIAEVRVGQIPLTLLARPFLGAIEARINDEANRQLNERAGPVDIKLLGITSDETQLRFYLTTK